VLTDASGGAVFPYGIPNSGAFVGVLIYGQYACLDSGANALGITTSDYARLLLGN
jgi:hypothetical protein